MTEPIPSGTPRAPVTLGRVIVETLGWTGTVCLLGGFLANTQGWLSSEGLPYLLLNVAGAAGVGVHAYVQRSWPAVVVEVVWVAIGLTSVLRHLVQ